jgi:AraC family chitin signaling transcriptional activator
MRISFIIFLLIYFSSTTSTSQELPPITNYLSETYKAGTQNWSITESNKKFIYVANNEGLLEYNGAHWLLYPSPNKTIIRSVCAVGDKVYSGSYMDFGYWEVGPKGVQQYTSLTTTLNLQITEDEQFWSITPYNKWILFQSLNRIYIFNTEDNTIKIIESEKTIHKLFKVDQEIYFYVIDEGLFTIQNGIKKKVFTAKEFNNDIIVQMLSINNSTLAVTQNSGLFEIKDTAVSSWNISVEKEIESASVYTALALKDGTILLGTVGNGIIKLSGDGSQLFNINQINGLGDNTALSLFEDQSSNVWVGLDNGLDCININSPYLNFTDRSGRLGTTYASIVFDDTMYLGTNQGLFYKPLRTDDDFKLIRGTEGQVWCLENINETLFCGHNRGTFQIQGASATLIANVMGTWDIKPIPGDNQHILLQGNYNGLNVLEKKKGIWRLRNKIKGFDISSKYFEFSSSNNVLVSHEYKGVYSLSLDSVYNEVTVMKKDTSVSKGANSSIAKFYGRVLYANEEGVFEFDTISRSFVKEQNLSEIYSKGTYVSGKLETNVSDMLWFFTKNGITYVTKEPFTDSYIITSMHIPISLRNQKKGYENISKISSQEYLFGTSNGYLLINTKVPAEETFTIYLNSIYVGETKEDVFLVANEQQVFKASEDCIVFEYSIPEYNTYKIPEFKYLLESNKNKVWSEWSANSSISFENLPYGDYTFRLKGRVNKSIEQSEAEYSFTIETPWYFSIVSITLYSIGFVFFFILVNAWYKRNYRKEKERILEKSSRDTALKELEVQKEIIQLKNDRLQQDIEARNRELAVSTMSMIKKNNVLNDFKAELLKFSEIETVAPLVKKINKSLNDKDDWEFFEKAFNHADKDFFKKVKDIHPELTANDLRFCVYLRLNLSSKEIAPLLNISHRSVEIKRYRLRKKISLDHDINLNNYFIDLK